MTQRFSVSSKKSESNGSAWQKIVRDIDLNTVHENVKCEISVIMENDPKASAYIRQLGAPNIADDSVIVIDCQVVHEFFVEIMFNMPDYMDPATTELLQDIFSTMSVIDLQGLVEKSISTKMHLIKLRIVAALKAYLFKYEEPIRHREALMEEYRLLIDVPLEAGAAVSKKKGSKSKKGAKAKAGKSKSKSKSSKGSKSKKGKKKGLDKAVKDEEPCLMLEDNVPKVFVKAKWHSVPLGPRTLQIVLASCYNFDCLRLLSQINVPLKCLVEVSLPSSVYPDVVSHMSPMFHTRSSLFDKVSNLSVYSVNDRISIAESNIFAATPSGDYTPLNSSKRHDVDEFWKEFDGTIHAAHVPKYICDMYYMKYVPNDLPIGEHLPFYDDQCLVTYDEIKYLLASTETIKRMHQNYTASIQEYNSVVDPEKPHRAFCFKKYSELLDCLPPDVCTVPIILDALLNEVEFQVAPKGDVKFEPPTVGDLSQKRSSSDILQQRPKFCTIRDFLATLLNEYRMYSSIDSLVPICNSVDNVLLNKKIDKKQIRVHENNNMAKCFHSYLHIRVSLESVFLNVVKRQPLCNILKRSLASERVKNCNEINGLAKILRLDADQAAIFLGIVLFNLINWASYKRQLAKKAKVDCNEEFKRLMRIMTGTAMDELEHCDSVMESKTCVNANREMDILFYEKLTKIEMVQEINSCCHWYNSIKYYYCSLLDSILVEVDNELNDFGMTCFNWACLLRKTPNLIRFSRNVLYEEMRWLMVEEMKYRRLLEAKLEMTKKAEPKSQPVNEDAAQEICFVLKSTLKDVLMNLNVPEEREEKSQMKKKTKKSDRVKVVASKESKITASSRKSSKSSRGSKVSDVLDAFSLMSKQEEPPPKKVFFVETGGDDRSNLTGRTITFISKDGVKITFDKNNDLSYNSVNIDLNQDHFIMHLTEDGYFKFHFYLQDNIIVNFVKPVNKSVVDHIKTDKLYTVLRQYSYRLNNFRRFIRRQSTYLISDDVLTRIRSNMHQKLSAGLTSDGSPAKIHRVTRDKLSPASAQETEVIGDLQVQTIETKQDALEQLKIAKASQQPAFKICSSKLHQFNYISRKKSHANISFEDAAREIANKRDPPTKHRYAIRELVGSIDNDDVTSNMPYNYSVTLPTSLTVRSETDVHGNGQIKQFYIDKGPQLKDIYLEVSRTFTQSGDVIIKMTDGQVKILALNGDIIKFEVPLFDRRVESKRRRKVNNYETHLRGLRRLTKCYHEHTARRICLNSSRKQMRHRLYQYVSPKSSLIAKSMQFPYPKYSILRVDGSKISFREGKYVQTRDYFPSLEEDYLWCTFTYRRSDGTVIELKRNGDRVTTFPDNTVLISSYEIDQEPVTVDVSVASLVDGAEVSQMVTCSDWVLIHSSRQFSHPKYATIKTGGKSNATDLLLPCDVTLHNVDQDFKLKINPHVEATFDTKTIDLATRFCCCCDGGTNTTINIEDLYRNKTASEGDLPKSALIQFRDSFKRHLDIQRDGRYTCNEDIETGLNAHQCATHRVFNSKKLYLLKHNLSGFRLWPKESYMNRLLLECRNSNNMSDLKVPLVDDVYFLTKRPVPLFSKYLMEPVDPEVYYETYRFLQRIPYNKHTKFLLLESECVALDAPPALGATKQDFANMTPSELELANLSSTTLFEAAAPEYVSCPQLTREDFIRDRYERIRRLCQLQRDREAAQRAKMKEPVNYFLYKTAQEAEERLHKRMIEECPTGSNLKLTYKAINLIPVDKGPVTNADLEDNSIHTIFSTTLRTSTSELFRIKSYVSTKRHNSMTTEYKGTHTSANLIKQHSALDLGQVSTLIHIYQLNSSSDNLVTKNRRQSEESDPG